MYVSEKDYFLDTYQHAAAQIGQEIRGINELIAPGFPDNCSLREETRRFALNGGKRFRPALSLVVASTFGETQIYPHLALETFHKYLLAHDDIIDRDDVRYSVPTVHAELAKRCPKGADSEHYGHALGIISGNLMEAATHKIILTAGLPDDMTIALQRLIVQAVEEVTWGWHDQFLMDYLSLDSPDLNYDRVEKSLVWVTGKYSIKLPLYYGYTLARQAIPAALEGLTDTMGALYQTGDDIIGLFGKTEDTGKTNSGDITQGKKTLPMWLTYERATEKDKATLRHCVGNQECTEEDIVEVRAIVERSGGLAATRAVMKKYGEDCKAQLAAIDFPPSLQRFLAGFVEFLQTRDR